MKSMAGSIRVPAMRRISREAGLTMLELIIACAILMILSSAALPIARYTVIKRKERDLKYNLRQIRDAIDYYKELADEGKFRTPAGSSNYPPDLETLVTGVQLGGANNTHKLRFLRKIPVDPMTGKADWGLRAVEDDPASTNWGGKNVYDVYSKSTAQTSDGTRYSDW
jgi:general secretion pathway protein G